MAFKNIVFFSDETPALALATQLIYSIFGAVFRYDVVYRL